MKLISINIIVAILLMTLNFNWLNMYSFESSIDLYNSYSNFFMYKLYLLPSGNITLLMIIYLLFTLIIVSNIIKIFNFPLRSN